MRIAISLTLLLAACGPSTKLAPPPEDPGRTTPVALNDSFAS